MIAKYHSCNQATKFDENICYHHILPIIKQLPPIKLGGVKEFFYNGKEFCLTKYSKTYFIWYNGKHLEFLHEPKLVKFIGNIKKRVYIMGPNHLSYELSGEYKDAYYYDEEQHSYLKVRDYLHTFSANNSTKIFSTFIDDEETRKTFFYINELRNEKNKVIKNTNELSTIIEKYEHCNLKNDSFSFFLTSKRCQLISTLQDFCQKSADNIFFFTGPSGTGKSITLLSFWKVLQSSMYINIKTLLHHSHQPHEVYSILSVEAIKLFNNYEKYTNCINSLRKSSYYSNYWLGIQSIIKEIREDNQVHIIMLDQYKERTGTNKEEMDIIKEMIKNTKIKVLVCSSINDKEIRENLLNQWLEIKNKSENYQYFPENAQSVVEDNLQTNKHFIKALELFSNIPKYYQLFLQTDLKKSSIRKVVKESKERIYKKIKAFLNDEEKEIELFIFTQSYCGTNLSQKEFEKVIEIVPLKYYVVTKEMNSFIIKPHFPVIYDIINEKIDSILKVYSKNFFQITKFITNRSFLGTLFEHIVHWQFSQGNLPFINVYIDEVIKVKDLIAFKDNNSALDYSVPSNGSIYLLPEKDNAELYDSAIIHTNSFGIKRVLYLQMTIHKKKQKLLTKETIEQSIEEKISHNFTKIFHFPLNKNNFCFSYVFLLEDEYMDMVKYCSMEKIPYIFFSIKELKFFDKKKEIIEELIFDPLFVDAPFKEYVIDLEEDDESNAFLLDSNNKSLNEHSNKSTFLLSKKRERNLEINQIVGLLSQQTIKRLLKIYNYENKSIEFYKISYKVGDVGKNLICVFVTETNMYVLNNCSDNHKFIKISLDNKKIEGCNSGDWFQLLSKFMINKEFRKILIYTVN